MEIYLHGQLGVEMRTKRAQHAHCNLERHQKAQFVEGTRLARPKCHRLGRLERPNK
jgi:hypothetical protein